MERRLRIGDVALGGRPRIVAAGGDAEIEALAAADDADLVELRADLFDDATPATLQRALGRLAAGRRPVVLTVRHASEGGRPMPDDQRLALYDAGLGSVQAIDVEIASAAAEPMAGLVRRAREAGRLVILSAHHLDGAPSLGTLLGQVAHAAALGADVTKLVTTARSARDVRTLLEATLSAYPRPVATFAMGPAGVGSRALFGLAGSLLTYGSVGRPTAPGQPTVRELRGWIERFYPA